MNRNIFLACAVVAIYLDQTKSLPDFRQTRVEEPNTKPNQPLQKSVLSFIDSIKTAGQATVNVGKTVVKGIAGTTNAALTMSGKAQSEILDGGVKTFKHGVDSVANLVKILQLPGLPPVVNTGNKAINLAADLTNMAGQTVLDARGTIINKTKDAVDTIAEAGGNVVGGGMEAASNVAKFGVNAGVDLVEKAASNLQTVDEYLDQLSLIAQLVTVFKKMSNQGELKGV